MLINTWNSFEIITNIKIYYTHIDASSCKYFDYIWMFFGVYGYNRRQLKRINFKTVCGDISREKITRKSRN